MRRSGASALLAILVAGVSIRLSPLLTYLYWGADIGEYHSILRDLPARGSVSTEYVGWGVTYPFFPGVFFLQGAGVALAGLDVPVVLSLLVPTLGALVALPVFLLAARLSRETKVALFAAAFVAVAMPHAYSTSHAAPSTLGEPLSFSGFLLFLPIPTTRGVPPPRDLPLPAPQVLYGRRGNPASHRNGAKRQRGLDGKQRGEQCVGGRVC